MSALMILGAVLALAAGVWVGLGAPGWPHPPDSDRRHTQRRALNPIAWGKSTSRRRLTPRTADERRRQLRGE